MLASRSILSVIAVALLLAGCRSAETPPPATGPRRCQAGEALPGSVPLPEEIVSKIAATDVPIEAVDAGRTVCNRLALEPGAFARGRALDPIDWRLWSAATLDEAKSLGRPLLVLAGFASCAECSRLAREELSGGRVAQDINENFVPVLVDHEERPDVGAYLMLATGVLTGGGGWPALVFLEPDGRPFEAHSWGAAATGSRKPERIVAAILRHIALGGGNVGERAALTIEKMQRRIDNDTTGPLPDPATTARSLRSYLESSFDASQASFGPPPLFARAPALSFLLSLQVERPDAGALSMVTRVLETLRSSELADPVGGGFHRYAAAAGWKEPAYEKMLADNAALAAIYVEAAISTGRDDLRDTARQTLDFLLRDLSLPSGGFAASLDASSRDAAGRICNGCYYQEDEATRLAALGSSPAREAALRARQQRSAPLRDERVSADANAQAVSAFARASVLFSDARYLDAATRAATFLDTSLREGGFVRHCVYAGDARCEDGYLSDAALVALAFVDLDAVLSGQPRWLAAAREIADELPRRFEHDGGGGFFRTAAASPALPLRLKPALDTVFPCGNSAAALLFVRLASRTGDHRYAEVARRTFQAFAEILRLRPLALPSMVVALGESAGLPQPRPVASAR